MTKQDRDTRSLASSAVLFVIVTLSGSFVVSFNVYDLLYLIYFCSFLCIYRISSRKIK